MAKSKKIYNPQKNQNLSPGAVVTSSSNLANQIAPKAVSQTRKDIKDWKKGEQLASMIDNPKWYLLQQLLTEVRKDPLLLSQIKNRDLKSLSKRILLRKPNGDIDEEQTDFINNAIWSREISQHILDKKYHKISLIEFSFNKNKELEVTLINRDNLDPVNGYLYKDYYDVHKIDYRNAREYGTWVLEFVEKEGFGLLNNAVPHVLFKKFAQSCNSELCEIAGIPPRVMKTNTHDKGMMNRAEKMMRDLGSAAWFIIDESESFEFAENVKTNGDLYTNFIKLCDDQNCLLINGAIIGQDTKNGSRSKDESSREVLQELVNADLVDLKQEWNSKVIPALIKLGILKGDVEFDFEDAEDLDQLFEWTEKLLPYKNIEDKWFIDKFGIPVTGDKNQSNPDGKAKLHLGVDSNDPNNFFV
ncbi:phage portal protein family protein [Wenyingzhuangia aestuarii]|uniref:phage portal protein family protein n=1 Tax=Wenyingzhuangia aestuarii TaxID=1647582 RepID=UPI00143AA97A|nr:DUF935 family protein [Wenyingzhuangia aestuarii]NJB83629.1 hypothetical protein [Wenyingzhuangia aestuarii]